MWHKSSRLCESCTFGEKSIEIMNTFIHHEGSTYIQYSKIKRQRKRERKKIITIKWIVFYWRTL